MTNLYSVLKSRDTTLPTKVHIVKDMVFPVVTYSCENWTIKKAKHQRFDAFELWCWRRLLKVPWTAARRSNQSILREINPEYSLERLMPKLQYFCPLMWTDNSLESPWCWERLRTEGKGGIRGWNGWTASSMQWIWTSDRTGWLNSKNKFPFYMLNWSTCIWNFTHFEHSGIFFN